MAFSCVCVLRITKSPGAQFSVSGLFHFYDVMLIYLQ